MTIAPINEAPDQTEGQQGKERELDHGEQTDAQHRRHRHEVALRPALERIHIDQFNGDREKHQRQGHEQYLPPP